jgi:hypothetical protein
MRIWFLYVCWITRRMLETKLISLMWKSSVANLKLTFYQTHYAYLPTVKGSSFVRQIVMWVYMLHIAFSTLAALRTHTHTHTHTLIFSSSCSFSLLSKLQVASDWWFILLCRCRGGFQLQPACLSVYPPLTGIGLAVVYIPHTRVQSVRFTVHGDSLPTAITWVTDGATSLGLASNRPATAVHRMHTHFAMTLE